jgi:hypothetical protein
MPTIPWAFAALCAAFLEDSAPLASDAVHLLSVPRYSCIVSAVQSLDRPLLRSDSVSHFWQCLAYSDNPAYRRLAEETVTLCETQPPTLPPSRVQRPLRLGDTVFADGTGTIYIIVSLTTHCASLQSGDSIYPLIPIDGIFLHDAPELETPPYFSG